MTSSESGTTRFVGRHRELASVKKLMAPAQLVTLTGPGGVGKSRLARRVLEQHHGEGWLVLLDDVVDPAALTHEVAHRLGLHPGPDPGGDSTVVDFFCDRSGLLVLDDADRALDGLRKLVPDLLARCPGLIVVVTTRETLGLPEEQVVHVAPLGLPSDEVDLTPEAAGRAESVRLFVDRARSVTPTFELNAENVDEVVSLCRALDGLPLAIEIAAARTRELSPGGLLERIHDRYRLLGPRFRDVPDRLGSLEASVALSYDLCSPAEQQLWVRLSVFVGGFGEPAAVHVCSGEGLEVWEVPALLDSLIAKSVVSVDREVEPAHHRMLDSVREYGAARLAEQGDPNRWRVRHGRWYADLAGLFADAWVGPTQAWWLSRMRLNHGNLLAALDFEHPERLRLLADAEMYWLATGSLGTARRWFDRVLESGAGDPALRFRARAVASYFSSLLLDPDTAEREVADLGRQVAGDADRAWLAEAEGLARLFSGDLEQALPIVSAGVPLARAEGLVSLELNLAVLEALLLQGLGRQDEAESAVAGTLARATELGDAYARAFALWISGLHARDAGHLDRAMDLELEALALKWPLRDHLGLALVLEALGSVTALQDDQALTGRLLGTAARVWRRVGLSPFSAPYLQAQRELAEQVARGDVDQRFARGFEEGSTTDGDATIADLLAARPVPEGSRAVLTPREREVADLVGEGLTNQQIASRLVISVRTVHGHMENILRKLGFGSRAQVAAWVARNS